MQKSVDVMPHRGVEQHLHAFDIGMNEGPAVDQAAIDMAFGGEVDNGVAPLHGCVHDVHIGNVTMNESDVIRQFVQVGHITAVGQQVEYANRPVWMVFCDRADIA